MTTKQFTDKVVLITGASQGIGAATARLFSQAGSAVVLASRSEEELAHNVEVIKSNGGEAMAIKTDVVNPASVENLVMRTVDASAGSMSPSTMLAWVEAICHWSR